MESPKGLAMEGYSIIKKIKIKLSILASISTSSSHSNNRARTLLYRKQLSTRKIKTKIESIVLLLIRDSELIILMGNTSYNISI